MHKFGRRTLVTLASGTALALLGATAVAHGSPGAGGAAQSGTASAEASISITNCKATLNDYITNDTTGLTTFSTTYVPVPGMTKGITTNRIGCVIVDVSAFAFSDANELQMVSVSLDGVSGNPVETQFNGDDDEDGDGEWARAHSALFAFASVPVGAHTVAMVHRSFFGGSVTLHRPAMQIQHR